MTIVSCWAPGSGDWRDLGSRFIPGTDAGFREDEPRRGIRAQRPRVDQLVARRMVALHQ